MHPAQQLRKALKSMPLVAILRGLPANIARDVGEILIDAGVQVLEVPLTSPSGLDSMAILADAFGDRVLIGTGTVTSVEQVAATAEAGGRLIVSPHVDTDVIEAALARDMAVIPGFFTPTEAFLAIRAGAHALKWFPANGVATTFFRSIRTILPSEPPILAVGGVSVETIPAFHQAGIDGFGVGGSLYRAGDGIADVTHKARAICQVIAQL